MLYNKWVVNCSRCKVTYRLHTLYDLPIKGSPIHCAYCGVANFTHLERTTNEANDQTWQEAMAEEFKQPWQVLEALYDVWLANGPMGSRFRDYLITIFGVLKV